jgi:hypothetical protein
MASLSPGTKDLLSTSWKLEFIVRTYLRKVYWNQKKKKQTKAHVTIMGLVIPLSHFHAHKLNHEVSVTIFF